MHTKFLLGYHHCKFPNKEQESLHFYTLLFYVIFLSRNWFWVFVLIYLTFFKYHIGCSKSKTRTYFWAFLFNTKHYIVK